MIASSALVTLVVGIIIVAVIFKLIEWFISYVGITEPFTTIIRLIVGIAILMFVYKALVTFVGHPIF